MTHDADPRPLARRVPATAASLTRAARALGFSSMTELPAELAPSTPVRPHLRDPRWPLVAYWLTANHDEEQLRDMAVALTAAANICRRAARVDAEGEAWLSTHPEMLANAPAWALAAVATIEGDAVSVEYSREFPAPTVLLTQLVGWNPDGTLTPIDEEPKATVVAPAGLDASALRAIASQLALAADEVEGGGIHIGRSGATP